MIYATTEGNGEHYSYHTSVDEANSYLLDLRKVYPDRDWDLVLLTPGRLDGQVKVIWGAECVVNVLDRSIHQWMKLYLWEGEVFKLPPVGEIIYKYLPMRFPFTGEHSGEAEIRRRLKDTHWEDMSNDQVRRTR